MKRTIKIIFTLALSTIFFVGKGQPSTFHPITKISVPPVSLLKNTGKKLSQTINAGNPEQIRAISPSANPFMLPADQFTREFGFFCKEELQLQKRTGVNFSLRLGTLEYCNYLEGKNREFRMKQ